jgi:hypothetical protein
MKNITSTNNEHKELILSLLVGFSGAYFLEKIWMIVKDILFQSIV